MGDTWLVAGAARTASRTRAASRSKFDRALDQAHLKPLLVSGAAQVLILCLVVVASVGHLGFLGSLAPRDPGASLGVLWQVHAVFVSLAFAGLTILFQLGTEQLITGNNLRAILFRHTYFQLTFLFAVMSLVQLGIIALWVRSSQAVFLEFWLCTVLSIGFVSLAYVRAGNVYRDPVKARSLAKRQLLDTLRASHDQNWALDRANATLQKRLPELFFPAPTPESDFESIGLVVTASTCTLADINIELISDAVNRLASVTTTTTKPQEQSGEGALDEISRPVGPTSVLRMRRQLGGELTIGRSVFTLYRALASEVDPARLESQLTAAVRFEYP